MKRTYWKVLRKNTRSSCWIRGMCCIAYPKGLEVKAPIGKLFIFETKKDANAFRPGGYRHGVFTVKCNATGVKVQETRLVARKGHIGCLSMIEFWKGKLERCPIKRSPTGTLSAKTVTCLE